VIGKIRTVNELMTEDGFDAVFIGKWRWRTQLHAIKGMNLTTVFSANEFLTRVNLMKAYKFPEYDTPVKIGKGLQSSWRKRSDGCSKDFPETGC